MINHFDAIIATHYDRDHCYHSEEEIGLTVAFLKALACGGRALEFAVGTGRIALPLAAEGIDVAGIELSEDMVSHLRRKEGGTAIQIAMGDMAVTRCPGEFSLVYLVFNTLSNLTTQEAQVACFRNAARHLQAGGHFVVENKVPPLLQMNSQSDRLAFARSDQHWGIDEIDTVTQLGVSHHVWMDEHGVRRMALPYRMVWPCEADLMAALAGLELVERWEDWSRSPFTAASKSHISVWRKP